MVEFNFKDLKIKNYIKNKFNSGVEIKHVPTGIKAECASYGSVYRNQFRALELLKEKLRFPYGKN